MDTVTLESGEVISKEFYEKLNSVSGKRARFVIDTIMKKGNCSTEDLKDAGYYYKLIIGFPMRLVVIRKT